MSTASPAEQDVLGGFGDPFVFPVSTCCTLCGPSRGKKPSFFFCCRYWFIRQRGQPASDPMAVAPRIIQVQLNKYAPWIFGKEACGSHKAFPVPLRRTWRHFLYGCCQLQTLMRIKMNKYKEIPLFK